MDEWLNEIYKLTEQFKECDDPDGRIMIMDLIYNKLKELNPIEIIQFLKYSSFIKFVDSALTEVSELAKELKNKKGE